MCQHVMPEDISAKHHTQSWLVREGSLLPCYGPDGADFI